MDAETKVIFITGAPRTGKTRYVDNLLTLMRIAHRDVYFADSEHMSLFGYRSQSVLVCDGFDMFTPQMASIVCDAGLGGHPSVSTFSGQLTMRLTYLIVVDDAPLPDQLADKVLWKASFYRHYLGPLWEMGVRGQQLEAEGVAVPFLFA